jgi:mRNA-degrading endonuclease RelE of RelBE toxin-antitoxin system
MSYKSWIDPEALAEAQATPGNVRQRLKRAMKALCQNPRPAGSKALNWPVEHFEPRRLRIGEWRIIYAVDDDAQWVWVLAVRKRPPYDYGDLAELLRRIG